MKENSYSPGDPMISLIADDYELLQVISRFGISMGFGDKTIAEVCKDNGVDTSTFLAIVNFMVEGYAPLGDKVKINLPSLLDYLRHSHSYFLSFCLPAIRRKLLDSMRISSADVSMLILRFFDEYTAEVRTHMEHEEQTVFKYVEKLLQGYQVEDYKVSTYSRHHGEVNSRLRELKKIIIKYCPKALDSNLLNEALYDIYRTEKELESHCRVEDAIFVPNVRHLEQKIGAGKGGEE